MKELLTAFAVGWPLLAGLVLFGSVFLIWVIAKIHEGNAPHVSAITDGRTTRLVKNGGWTARWNGEGLEDFQTRSAENITAPPQQSQPAATAQSFVPVTLANATPAQIAEFREWERQQNAGTETNWITIPKLAEGDIELGDCWIPTKEDLIAEENRRWNEAGGR